MLILVVIAFLTFSCVWNDVTLGFHINHSLLGIDHVFAPESLYMVTSTQKRLVLNDDSVQGRGRCVKRKRYILKFKLRTVTYHAEYRTQTYSNALNEFIVQVENNNKLSYITELVHKCLTTKMYIIEADIATAACRTGTTTCIVCICPWTEKHVWRVAWVIRVFVIACRSAGKGSETSVRWTLTVVERDSRS